MKTKNLETITKITKIVTDNPGIESSDVANKIGISYDTTARYLKKMTNDGILTRKAISHQRETKFNFKKTTLWEYHYYINSGDKK